MRRGAWLTIAGVLLLLSTGCALGVATPTVVAPTATVIPTPTATITPFVGIPTGTPAFYPTPTMDRGELPHAPGALRNANWPVGTAAIATYAVRPSVDVDVGVVVLTVPVPEGTTLTFYFAVPPQRGYSGRASFPASQRVQSLQPGDAVRIVGVAAGTVRVPPVEGTYNVVNINGLRFARSGEPLTG